MIQPARHDFKFIPGATFDYRFQYLVGPQPSVVPVNLTGYGATWLITSPDGNTTYALYNLQEFGDTVSGVYFGGDQNDPTNGVVDLVIDATDTAILSFSTAIHSLSMIVSSMTIPLLTGSIVVQPGFAIPHPSIPLLPSPTLYPSTTLYPHL